MLQSASLDDLKNLCATDDLTDIFCKLVSFDTKSDPTSQTVPSTKGQLVLGAYLVEELKALGYEPQMDDLGVVTTKVKASEGYENCKRLCFLAHLDTAPDASGANVSPRLVKNFKEDGIKLDNGLVIDNDLCPNLKDCKGYDIIVTDGTTLLGADDKAGVAVMVELLKTLKKDPSIKHGPLCFAFSVDEEIGTSADHLSLEKIDCDYGITIDGSSEGELDVATFNASKAKVDFTGVSVHTAVAYKVLKNAVSLAAKFIELFPSSERPETTRDLEGFYHIHNIEGRTEAAHLDMIIRDFDLDGLKKREDFVRKCASFINDYVGYEACKVTITKQYRNLGAVLAESPEILDICRKSYKDANLNVIEKSIRGGTDGSNLSCRGLPCPNIFTGALNCHGPYECLPVQSLHKSYDVALALISNMTSTVRK